jgi:hypothetical protein
MAKTLVGALRVTLGLDSAEFSAGATKAQGIGQRLGKSLRTIGVAAAGMGIGIAAGVKRTLDYADRMGETAEKLGMPVEALSALGYAAEQTGVPFESLEGSLVRLSKNLADSPDMFADLGVAIRDSQGAMRPTADILADIADKFQAMPDGAEKTALAMQLFGKSGADMVLALNGGSEGLNALMQEARDLGIVISDETADAAGKFNDNLGKLQTAAGGLGVQLAAELAPALERISGYAVDAAKAFGQLSPETKEMVAQVGASIAVVGAAAIAFGLLSLALSPVSLTIGLIAGGAMLIYDNWEPITAWFKKFWEDIKIVAGYAWNKIKEFIAGAATWAEEKWNGMIQFFSDIWDGIVAKVTEAWNGIKATIGGAVDWVTRKWDAFVGKLESAIQTAKDVGTAISDALSLGEAGGIGAAVPEGFVSGLLSGRVNAATAGAALAQAVLGSMRTTLDTNSPSRVAAGIGVNVAEGLAEGMTTAKGLVGQAAEALSNTAAGALQGIGNLGEKLGDMFAGAATNVLTGVQSLQEAVGQLLQQIAQLLINSAMKSLFGNIFDGLGLGSLPGYATGTASAAAGWAMVGEQGPELINFGGGGAQVYDNADTRRMLSDGGGSGGGAGGPVQVTSNVYLDGKLILSTLETAEGEMALGGAMRRMGYTG